MASPQPRKDSRESDDAVREFDSDSRQAALDQARQRIEALLDADDTSAEYRAGVRASLLALSGAAVPSDADWQAHANRLVDELLAPLDWAGWETPDEFDSDFDVDNGAMLFGELYRTGMRMDVEYRPDDGELRLCPDDVGSFEDDIPMLDDEVVIDVSADGAREVARVAGDLGLLNPTRVRATEDSDVGTAELVHERLSEYIFEPTDAEGISIEDLQQDTRLSAFLDFYCGGSSRGVLPDLVPDAVALGIALVCWRNETAVEKHHLADDVSMARVDIAVTKAIQPHVDPFDGIDWDGIEAALTDPAWALPDGRVISELFGDGWPEVSRTVAEELDRWRGRDDDLLGVEATMRLLTIAGASTATGNWWGHARWPALCRAVVADARAAGVALPTAFRDKSEAEFVDALTEPDLLDDETLGWLIDMPGTGADGPKGTRFHEAGLPIVRSFALYRLDPEEFEPDPAEED